MQAHHWTIEQWSLENLLIEQIIVYKSGAKVSGLTNWAISGVKRKSSGSAEVHGKSVMINDFLYRGTPYDEGINISTNVATTEENSEKADTSADRSPLFTSGQCLCKTDIPSWRNGKHSLTHRVWSPLSLRWKRRSFRPDIRSWRLNWSPIHYRKRDEGVCLTVREGRKNFG